MKKPVVGVLGGGQLGRMLAETANNLNVEVAVLDGPNAPAKQVSASPKHIVGSFKNADDVRRLANVSDILTMEIEHVDTTILEELENQIPVQPSWSTVRVIQDKYKQKQHLQAHDIQTAESFFVGIPTVGDLERMGKRFGYPFMLKSCTDAYDGRGNFAVRLEKDIPDAIAALKGRPLYVEKWADFHVELAVMVVKTKEAENVAEWQDITLAFPVVETIHEDSICKLVYAPARGISGSIRAKAQLLARRAVASFKGKGVFGVELFLLPSETILVNEIAPRPHNSGHYTIEACHMSQYEAHLRAILDWPIPRNAADFLLPTAKAVMLNILGGKEPNSHLRLVKAAINEEGAKIHDYGKGEARPGRKMGHITMIGDSIAQLRTKIRPLLECFDQIRADRLDATEGTLPLSKDLLRPAKAIAITMGSDSDLPVLKPAFTVLDELGIEYETTITSAHRTPTRMLEFAQQAAERGVKVVIAAAGGAAHLPGMLASSTPLPVIGVPVKGSTMDGMDSLLSIVQMPRGVPVATVAVNNSTNAALLAVRILATSDDKIMEKMTSYMKSMEAGVLAKAAKLENEGWEKYSSVET
ncbi:MAG: hypothetical protein Q9160_002762 [Pyrenula sp. 1 TL-2023]